MKEDKETSETNGSIEVTKYDTIQLPDDDSSKGKILSYFILILICIGGLCQSFCYDNPIPLQTQIEEYLNLSSTKYNLLFSFYYLPNIVTPFLIGYLSDACGRKVGMMLSSVLILFGQLLFVIGITIKSFISCLFGRMIFGIGAEGYVVISMDILSYWTFNILATSLAIESSFQRIGSALNDYLIAYLYNSTQMITLGFWIGFGFAIFCVAIAIGYSLIEWCYDKKERQVGSESIKFSEIINFPIIYWALAAYIALIYMVMISFNANTSGMLQTRFGFSVTLSGILLCIPLVMVIIGNPIIGLILDKKGRYTICFLISAVGFIFLFSILSLIPNSTPKVIIFMWFTAYGLLSSVVISSVWPAIKLITPSGLAGTAYGLTFSLEDIALFFGPMLTGFVIDKTKGNSNGYFWSIVLLLSISFLATVIAILIAMMDHKSSKVLHDGPQKMSIISNSYATN